MGTRSCACGCGRVFEAEESPRGGRPRVYLSPACRKRAQRQRQENTRWIKAVEGELHVIADPPSKQIANAIAETSTIAAAFRRLAIEETSPVLAAGSERIYLEILAALDRNFPGWSAS
jgi:hypothetical protein